MVFHVLNRANARARIFAKDADYAAFERVMRETSARKPMRILGYLIMPNHWHLLLWPERDGELGAFMQRLTTTHVRRWHLHRRTVGCGHLYQGTYKSFPIEADEHLLTVLRYVERNALRAGLVPRAEEWPWSSLRWHGTGRGPEFLTEGPVSRPAGWVEWVNEPQGASEEDALRRCIRRGMPWGGADWVKRTAVRLGLESSLHPRGRPRKNGKK